MSAAGTIVIHILAPGMSINEAKYIEVLKKKLNCICLFIKATFTCMMRLFGTKVRSLRISWGGKTFDCWTGPDVDQI